MLLHMCIHICIHISVMHDLETARDRVDAFARAKLVLPAEGLCGDMCVDMCTDMDA